MSSSAPSRKRARYAIAETSTEHQFAAVDAVLTLLNKRSIPPTLQLVSRVASSALSASIGGGGIIFDDQRLVELVSIAKGILLLGPLVVGGGGPLHVSVVSSVQGNTKRDISARLCAFREAVAVAARATSEEDGDDNQQSAADSHHVDDAVTVASTFGTSSSSIGDAEITAFPTALADEWVQRAVAEMALETKPLLQPPPQAMPSPPPPPPPPFSSPLNFDTPLLTISTRGLASRAGGVWPIVQRRIDDGLQQQTAQEHESVLRLTKEDEIGGGKIEN